MGAQISQAIDVDYFNRIDTAIAVSLGWQLTFFVDEDRIQKDNYVRLLEPSFNLVVDKADEYSFCGKLPNLMPNIQEEYIVLSEQKTYYQAPEEGEFDCDVIWRWLEVNQGIPQFTRNQEDLEILLQAIDKEKLTLRYSRQDGKNICVLEGASGFIEQDYCGYLQVGICLAWLKFYNIEI